MAVLDVLKAAGFLAFFVGLAYLAYLVFLRLRRWAKIVAAPFLLFGIAIWCFIVAGFLGDMLKGLSDLIGMSRRAS